MAAPGYEDYTSWADWARLRVGARAGLASSYDRSGANHDYSWYEWPEGLQKTETPAIIRTINSPGVVYRFWMPHVTADCGFMVRMFFDGEQTPRIDTTSDAVYDGAFSYFTSPLVTTCAGGQVCYEPIPFAHSLRIETVNHELPDSGWSAHRHYYQYSYVTFAEGTVPQSYTGTLSAEQQQARARMVELFDNPGEHPAGDSPTAVLLSTPGTVIAPGDALTLAEVTGPGTIRRLTVRMDGATDEQLGALHLVVTYDDEPAAAIDVAVSDFFGAGHQRAPYRSLPLGTDSPDGEGFYCYWPMPYRHSVSVALANTGAAAIPVDAAAVEYEPGPLATESCYLRVHAFSDVREPGQVYHPMLSAAGRGHYVGSLLYLEQASDQFNMLEGDEVVCADGMEVISGTGTEDAYNGGYYYNWVAVQGDEPEGPRPQAAIRPLHGILYVHRETGVALARADQYRWCIGERYPFSESIEIRIENKYSVVGAKWTSVVFWYQQPPVPADADGDGDLDLADFAAFQGCFGATTADCLELFDLDSSEAVDLADLAAFHDGFTGPW